MSALPSVEPKTELARFIVRRLESMGMSRAEAVQRFCKAAGFEYTRSQNARLSMILGGRKPITEAYLPYWAKALRIERGSPEMTEFLRLVMAHRLLTVSRRSRMGAAAEHDISHLGERIKALEDDNARLLADNAELRAELRRRGSR